MLIERWSVTICNYWCQGAHGLYACSFSRVNQEKMKRHRETILPSSPPKGPSTPPKGRVAAPDRRQGVDECTQNKEHKFLFYTKNIFFMFGFIFCLTKISFFLGCREESLWTKWPRVTRKTGAAHWKGCGECSYPVTPAITLHRSFHRAYVMLNLSVCLPQQILNCALDDIEIFVARLQKAAEAFSQLNQRNKSKKNKKKGPAGLSPFLLMWWHGCSDNMFILLTWSCLCLFVSCGPGLSSSDVCVVVEASLELLSNATLNTAITDVILLLFICSIELSSSILFSYTQNVCNVFYGWN